MTDHDPDDLDRDDQRVALLRRAADAVPVGPLHADLLVATAHRRRRQRRGAVLAAAAVLVVAGGTAAIGMTGDDPSRPRPEAPAVQPAPTVDTRLVGVGRLAVEVPASWRSGKVQCAVSRPMVFDSVGRRDCLVRGPAPYVALVGDRQLPDDSPVSQQRRVPGGLVLVSEQPMRTDRGLVVMHVSHEGSGYLEVATRSEAETQAITDSARIISADQVAVPWTPAAIEAAGLVVEEVTVITGDRYPDQYLLGTNPGGGTVVPAGSTVTVRVARSTAWPPGEPGPAISCVYDYPEDLPDRAQAVGGTVTRVEVGEYDPDAGASRATITLAVDEWFIGGPGEAVVLNTFVFMLPDDPQDAVGTRILAAFGPSRDVMGCGFTRAWDETAAREWRAAY